LFVGFETFSPQNLKQSNKKQNLQKDYVRAVKRLHDLGIMINGSFVFGLDEDDKDVFKRTVEWGVENGITTSTYHILTPYPGTQLFSEMQQQDRILTRNWDQYDTRHVVYQTKNLTAHELESGYHWAYKEFYNWSNIFRASMQHDNVKHMIKHFAYSGGWKKFEPLWNFIIKTKSLGGMLPLLESILSKVNLDPQKQESLEDTANVAIPVQNKLDQLTA
jgi:radical SAM superfamily enzyme YgiQ (UPF0313 family)